MTTPTPSFAKSATLPQNKDADRRSSSLSDLIDALANDEFDATNKHNNDNSDANDTEAETERLEDSPFKRQKHQNVLLAADGSEPAMPRNSPFYSQSRSQSEAESVGNSSEDGSQLGSVTSLPRKRKRSDINERSEVGLIITHRSNSDKSLSSRSVSPKSPFEAHILRDEAAQMPVSDLSESDDADDGERSHEQVIYQSGKRGGGKSQEEQVSRFSSKAPTISRFRSTNHCPEPREKFSHLLATAVLCCSKYC